MYDLRPYQLIAVKKQLDQQRIIVADDMSMGKCLETIAAKPLIDKEVGYRPSLIICPPAVMPHWEKEIRKWHYKGERTQIAKLDVGHLANTLQASQGAEFIIGPYSLLSYLGKHSEALTTLKRMQFSQGILDEGHLMSNPDSLRTQAARELFHNIPYLSILTGTPIPNTLIDIYSQLNLIDREAFPITGSNADALVQDFYQIIRSKPHLIRDILHSRMLRRTAEDYLGKRMPILEQKSLEVQLKGEHEDTYQAVYENDDVPVCNKLWELMKISLDPNLANPNYLPDSIRRRIGKMESCTFDRVEELVQDIIINEHGKVLSFSDLKKQIIPSIQKRFARYGALAVTQEVLAYAPQGQISPREEMRRLFQFNPEYNFMVATNIMDVGVDLTAATHILHWTLPFMPATLDQRISRTVRVTGDIEKERVISYTIKPVMSNGAPTINEGIMQLLDDKRRIIRYIMESPEKLTLEDLMQIKNGPENSHTLAGFLSEKSSMDWHLGSLKGRGGKKILAEYQEKPWLAQNLAHAYAKHWDGYYGGNAATLSAAVIRQITGKPLESISIVDICSGPFSLSRRLGIPVMNLDLNEYMIMAGKLLEEEGLVPRGNEYRQGLANALPFEDDSYALANCSLALHMSSLVDVTGNGRTEREEIFREAHRVSDLYVFTLPHSVIHRSDLPYFTEGLTRMGWNVLPQTGFYRGTQESRFKVFLGAVQKDGEGQEEALPEEFLRWTMDDRLLKRRKGKTNSLRKNMTPKSKKETFEIIPEFVHEDSGKMIRGVA